MFRRDQYDGDFSRNYFPQDSYQHFKKDFHDPGGQLLHMIIYNEKERDEMKNVISWGNYTGIPTLIFSAGALIGRNRLPGLKRITGTWKRVFAFVIFS
jgi:hypothetical protein